MDQPSTIYQILLVLHIAAAIVGFGGVIAHGAYNARAFRASADEAAVLLRSTQAVTNVAHYGIYAVFAFGLLLVALSEGEVKFSDPWISAAFVLWFLLVGVAHGLVRPTSRALLEQAQQLPANEVLSADPTATAMAKKLALGEGLTQLLLVISLVTMVWQFGG